MSQLVYNSKRDQFEYIYIYYDNHSTFIIMLVKFDFKILLPLAINLLWENGKTFNLYYQRVASSTIK